MMRQLSLATAVLILTFGAGCSLGQGTGEVKSDDLFAHECWGATDGGPDGGVEGDEYNLVPDFFAAIPYRSTLQIRVQRSNDLQEVSDGLAVLIDDVPKIRAKIKDALDHPQVGGSEPGSEAPSCGSADVADGGSSGGTDGGADGGASSGADDCPAGTVGFQVALPAGVTPPGSPAVPPDDLLADPPLVHASLYLHHSCHNQNTVLYAVSGKVCFSALFSGDPNESDADNKLTEAKFFKLQVGDLRDVPLGHYPRDIPCDLQSTVRGSFRFYFERGQPAQPFP